jgi:hypothetical protein
MRSLSAPNDDPSEVYDCIVRHRKRKVVREFLSGVRPQVLSAYGSYASCEAEELVRLAPLTLAELELKALRGNYETLRDRKGGLYDRLRLSTSVCPLCGERDPTTLDHTLPRTTWGEFSILPENLVPACGVCNLAKGGDVVDDRGEAVFLNPYRDDLTGLAFLDATIETSSGTAIAQYFIRTDTDIDIELLARIERHFRKLRLDDLYRVKAIPELLENTLLVGEMHVSGVAQDAIRDTLGAQARRTATVVGPNHWRSVLHKRLAEHEDFLAGACTPISGAGA